MRRDLLPLLFLLPALGCVDGDLSTLQLTLMDFATGDPQDGAEVRLIDSPAEEAVITDAEGKADVPVLQGVFYELSITALPLADYQPLILPGVAPEEDFPVSGWTLDRTSVGLNVTSAGDDPCAQPAAPISIDPALSVVILSMLDMDGDAPGPATGAVVSIDAPHATPIVDLVDGDEDEFTFCDDSFCTEVCGQTAVTIRADSNGAVNFLQVPPSEEDFEVTVTPPAGQECFLVPGDAPPDDLFFSLAADTWTWLTYHCRTPGA